MDVDSQSEAPRWREWASENISDARFAVDRANHDAWEAVGGESKKGLRTVAGLVMLAGIVRTEWFAPAVKGIALVALTYVFFWGKSFDAAWVYPARHKRWKARTTTLPGEIIRLELLSLCGHQGPGIACEVQHPNGILSRAEKPPAEPGTWSGGARFEYADGGDFPHAPPPMSGRYEVTWFEQGRKGKWYRVVKHSEEINLVA